MSSNLEHLYRRSLARFPKAWQEEHADVVLGMLLDDAEAKSLHKVPVAQRVGLWFQGMAEHSTFRRVRILAASATVLWIAGLVLVMFPGLIQGSMFEATKPYSVATASLEGARSVISFALPYFLTIMALTGFLYRIGWLAAWLRLAVNFTCGLGLLAATAGSWLSMVSHVENSAAALVEGTPLVDSLNTVGLGSIVVVPAVLVLGLAWHLFSLKSGRAPVVLVIAVLGVVFTALVFRGSGLIQVLAPTLFLAAWLQERSSVSWLGLNKAPRDPSHPRIVEWTHS